MDGARDRLQQRRGGRGGVDGGRHRMRLCGRRQRRAHYAAGGANLGITTFAITVAYNPSPQRLAAQMAALAGQVDAVIVVDNASTVAVRGVDLEQPGLDLAILRLPSNQGIAGGLNAGIGAARERGATRFLLLDHDSVPPSDMVPALARVLDGAGPTRVAAVGPTILDARNRHPFPFVQLGWFRNQHIFCSPGQSSVSCDLLISSGILLDAAMIESLGDFDERLFIDSVDFEWCCRARHAGYQLLGVCATTLDHELGDDRRRVLGTVMVVHSPLRHYYMTRNRIALYFRGYVPLRWKLKDVLRMLVKNTATVLFIFPRRRYLRMILAGLIDALRGRVGPHAANDS